MMPGLESTLSTLRQFFPPEYSLQNLENVLTPIFETLKIAAASMLLVVSGGLSIALYIGASLPASRILYALLTSVRAIPDLTLAIFCVMLLGLGPAAGILALTIFYTANMGKVFSDLFASADPGPVEALRATGANKLQVALFGLLPLRVKDLLTYGGYEFECATRASVIVGAVGAGGIGAELVSQIQNVDYHRVTTLVLLLIVLITLIDFVTRLAIRYPKLLFPILAFGVAALWGTRPQLFAFRHTLTTLGAMFPPILPRSDMIKVPALILETLEIAVGGTLVAMIFGVLLGLAAARNLTPWFIHVPIRRFLDSLRAVPEVAWGLILVGLSGLGPGIGVLALGLHSTGSLGKLFSESMENVPQEPVTAIASTGASPLKVALFAYLPLALPPIAVYSLFRLEWNMRTATIVGMIGAGGIGEALYNAQQLMFYQKMTAYLLITWLLIVITDAVNARLRYRWRFTEVAPHLA
ncbi:MAG TPA: ABC transporter permease subunit [Candidatus Angelobacter sp.]|nr:ABC transporter permease subunit [Candidatus Angelobacter sp.]